MKKFYLVLPVLFILLGNIVSAQSLDEIISKSLLARGGVDNIKNVQTQRMTGKISFGNGSENPFIVSFERPGKIREEIIMNEKKIIEINDGKEGWVVNPFSGSDAPRPMNEDELKNTSSSADIDGPLIAYTNHENQIRLLGIDTVKGKPAYKLFIKQANGQTRYDYIDTASYLELKWEGTILNNGHENHVESFFNNYKKVDGMMYSFEIDSDSPGGSNSQKIIFDNIEINSKLDESIFGQPAPAPNDSTKP